MEKIIYDLHTHSLYSDGELLPYELAYRALANNIKTIGITDHVDISNMEQVISALNKVAADAIEGITIITGVELTYIPPLDIEEVVKIVRKAGVKLIIGHGESLIEPVPSGSNIAYIKAKVDILAHPGKISEEEVFLAKENDVYLEITARKGHCYGNGHVAKLVKKIGGRLILNSDAHLSSELLTQDLAMKVAIGAGLDEKEFDIIINNAKELIEKIMKK